VGPPQAAEAPNQRKSRYARLPTPGPSLAGRVRSGLIQPDQKLFEDLERTHLAVHGERLAQSVADAGMHRRRRDFHEAPGGSMDHGF